MKPTREQLVEELNKGICSIIFTKVDGSERTMNCTLNMRYLSEAIGTGFIKEEIENTKNSSPDVIPVWDTDVNGWRSFRIESVKSFNSPTYLAG